MMRSLSLQLAVTAAMVRMTAAQPYNPIYQPRTGETVTAGTTYDIMWTPTSGNPISIELWFNNPPANANLSSECGGFAGFNGCTDLLETIVDTTSNAGHFTWFIPVNLPTGNSYFLDLFEPGGTGPVPIFFISGFFRIENRGTSSETSLPSTGTSASPTIATISQSGNGLSAGATGGIVGAVLGTALIIAIITVWYCARRRSTAGIVSSAPMAETTANQTDSSFQMAQSGNPDPREQLGGRLQYSDSIILGGRLQPDVQ